MGWAVRVAPGVRVALTPRGIRTSVGPRGARIHFGAGRPTVSTGAGPLTLWTGVGQSRRRPRPARSLTAHERQVRAAGRLKQYQDVRALHQAFTEHVLNAHLQQFRPAQAPVVPAPEAVDEKALEAAREKQALQGLSLLRRAERRHARERARAEARRRGLPTASGGPSRTRSPAGTGRRAVAKTARQRPRDRGGDA